MTDNVHVDQYQEQPSNRFYMSVYNGGLDVWIERKSSRVNLSCGMSCTGVKGSVSTIPVFSVEQIEAMRALLDRAEVMIKTKIDPKDLIDIEYPKWVVTSKPKAESVPHPHAVEEPKEESSEPYKIHFLLNKETRIIKSATPAPVEITYEQFLSVLTPREGDTVSIMYSGAADGKSGMVVPGQPVQIVEGTIVNAIVNAIVIVKSNIEED